MLKKKNPNKIKQCKQDNIFDVVNGILITLMLLIVIIPIINLIALSFSDSASTLSNSVFFLPKVNKKLGVTFDQFKYVLGFINSQGQEVTLTIKEMFSAGTFLNSVKNTAIITIFCTVLSNLVMALCAYPMSKSDFPFKKPIMIFFLITMLFSPGILPIYIFLGGVKINQIQLTPNLLGTLWPVLLLGILNVYNMLLIKTTYEGIPKELEESAVIDGASSLTLFFKIVIPLSVPVIASCCFFTVVGCINSYSGALLFIGTNSAAEAYEPMALYIYKILTVGSGNVDNIYFASNQSNITSATIVLSMIPILAIYPFVIKYIKSGLTLGSVKG